MSLLWLPVAFAAVVGFYFSMQWLVDRSANRHYDRLRRAADRRKLRYDTWNRISRLGGE